MFKLTAIFSIGMLLAGQVQAATPMTSSANTAPPPAGSYCAWGSGNYSNGTRMCVSATRLMICVNGEWRVDETRTPFTEDVCRQDNPRAPTFGK
ncbi:MAG: hypothetical protein JO208_05590 [Alphaproteobacteria bacterium]|nr:hypothetical protein [Alphaproteobacteria bacterium]